MGRSHGATARALALAGLAAILAGCMPEPVTTEGARVSALYGIFLAAAAVVFVVVAGLIGWSIVRYRATDDDRLPSGTHENIRLELLWWALPTLLVIGLIILTAQVLTEVDRRTEDPDLTVNVTGSQWQWEFAYQGTDVVVTGLPDQPPVVVLPVGRRIAFNLSSPDVIHSFWVPQFLIKRDVLPDKTNRMELTIEEEGTYSGVCGEFCGLLHHRMLFSIEAVPADAFDRWLAAGGEGAP
ncbi:MAG TPA: cytochrome c oxidase subunit II [candidate division Zixibacteria bacterium]|nr:cytochrome c oxidase subunit II [candidate division Zixibacteria bacterium]